MSEALPISTPPTSEDSPSATSSPASEDGPKHYDWLDGPTIVPSGLVAAPANLSASQAKERGLLTSGTYGHLGFTSSRSESLQSSLVSRLMQRLDTAGSTLFKLTWKRSDTPSGRQLSLLRASVLRTGVTVFASWPTPCANPANGEPEAFLERKRRSVARGSSMGIALTDIQMVAKLASWPSPMAGTPAQKGYNEAGNTDSSRRTVALCSWVSPSSRDWKDTPGMSITREAGRSRLDQLPRQEQLAASGETLMLSTAETASCGQLNPFFVAWLMGYPKQWLLCYPAPSKPSRKK